MRGPASTTLVLLFFVVGTITLGPVSSSKLEVPAAKKTLVNHRDVHYEPVIQRNPAVIGSVRKPLVEAFKRALESTAGSLPQSRRSVRTVDADHTTLEHPVVLAFQKALSEASKKALEAIPGPKSLKLKSLNLIRNGTRASKLSPEVKQAAKNSKHPDSMKVVVHNLLEHAHLSAKKPLAKAITKALTSKPDIHTSHSFIVGNKKSELKNSAVHAFEGALKKQSGASRGVPELNLKPINLTKLSTGVKPAAAKNSVKTPVGVKSLVKTFKTAMGKKSVVPASKAHEKLAEKKLKLNKSVKNPVIHALAKSLTGSSRKALEANLKHISLTKLPAVRKQATVEKHLADVLKITMASKKPVLHASKVHEKVAEKKLKLNESGKNPVVHAFAKALTGSSRKTLEADLKPMSLTKLPAGVKQATVKNSVKKSLASVKKPLSKALKELVLHAPKAHEKVAEKKLKPKESDNPIVHAFFKKSIAVSSRKALKHNLKPINIKSAGAKHADLVKSPVDLASAKKPLVKAFKNAMASKAVDPVHKTHEKVAEKKLKLKETVKNPEVHAIAKQLAIAAKEAAPKSIVLKHPEKSAQKSKDSTKNVPAKKSESLHPAVVFLSSLPKAEAEKYEEYLKKAVADYNAPLMTAVYRKRNKDKIVMQKVPDGSFIMGFDEKYAMCLIRFRVNGHEVTADPKISHFTLCIPYLRVMVNEFLNFLGTKLKA